MIRFVPGTYSAPSGITDPYSATVTITRVEDVETPEPPTVILLLSGAALGLLLLKRIHA